MKTMKTSEIIQEWNLSTINQRVGMIGKGIATINKEYNRYYTHLNWQQLTKEEQQTIIILTTNNK